MDIVLWMRWIHFMDPNMALGRDSDLIELMDVTDCRRND